MADMNRIASGEMNGPKDPSLAPTLMTYIQIPFRRRRRLVNLCHPCRNVPNQGFTFGISTFVFTRPSLPGRAIGKRELQAVGAMPNWMSNVHDVPHPVCSLHSSTFHPHHLVTGIILERTVQWPNKFQSGREFYPPKPRPVSARREEPDGLPRTVVAVLAQRFFQRARCGS